MPTYEYACGACGHTFEQFQSIKAEPLRVCPQCQAESLARLLGTGAGIVFKGAGFYTTDYRSDSYASGAKADSAGSTGSSDAANGKAATAGSDAPASTENCAGGG